MGGRASGGRRTAIMAAAAALVGVLGSAGEASAATTLGVAVGGDDSAAGTVERPLRTIQRAVDLAGPGDTVVVRGGTYALTDNVSIGVSGRLAAHHPERVPGRAGGRGR